MGSRPPDFPTKTLTNAHLGKPVTYSHTHLPYIITIPVTDDFYNALCLALWGQGTTNFQGAVGE